MSTEKQQDATEVAMESSIRPTGLQGQTVLPAVMQQVLGDLAAQPFHNFDGDKMNKWRLASIATGPDVLKSSDIINKTFKLRYFYAHKVEIMSDQGGELFDAVRCVLIDDQDQAVGFVSDGLAKDLAMIVGMFGLGPYNPPIPVEVVQIQTRKGFRTYQLRPAS